jgi:hypothetical protein
MLFEAVRVGRGEGPEPIEFTLEGATELERVEGLVECLQLAVGLRDRPPVAHRRW